MNQIDPLDEIQNKLLQIRQKNVKYQESLVDNLEATFMVMNQALEAHDKLRIESDPYSFYNEQKKLTSLKISKDRSPPQFFYKYDPLLGRATTSYSYFNVIHHILKAKKRYLMKAIQQNQNQIEVQQDNKVKKKRRKSTSHQIQESKVEKQKEQPQVLTTIKQLISEQEHPNWVVISQQVNTQYNTQLFPCDCLQRYLRSQRPLHTQNRYWTKQQDSLLTDTVQKIGHDDWQDISIVIDTRSSSECFLRWQKKLDPSILRGKWDQSEDIKLYISTIAYEQIWTAISQHVRGRTDLQCRERFCNILDAKVKTESWNQQQDNRLLKFVELNGKRWAKAARFLGNRTDNQVMRRWNYLIGSKQKKIHVVQQSQQLIEPKIVKKKVAVEKKKSKKAIKSSKLKK